MKITKKLLYAFVTSVLLFSLSLSSSATNRYFNRGYNYNTRTYSYNVNFKNYNSKVTVVNTCSSPLDVYIGGVFRRSIARGQEVTAQIFWKNTSVVIHPRATTTHSFRIKTTGNYDTISRTR